MVERSLRMREARGSIPRISIERIQDFSFYQEAKNQRPRKVRYPFSAVAHAH